MRVYGSAGKVEETCPYGDKHTIHYAFIKDIVEVGRYTYEYYTKNEAGVFADKQGRWYFERFSIDYHGHTTYRREDDGVFFSRRPEDLGQYVRDISGNPLTTSTPTL